jgi:hypothetical protein
VASHGVPYIPGVSGVRPQPRAAIARLVDDADLPDAYVGVLREGMVLLDAGHPWEAHECFEVLWHACGRDGPRAAVMQALAKVGAALVKERQGSAIGRETHARGALALVDDVLTGRVPVCGVDVRGLREVLARMLTGETVTSWSALLDVST